MAPYSKNIPDLIELKSSCSSNSPKSSYDEISEFGIEKNNTSTPGEQSFVDRMISMMLCSGGCDSTVKDDEYETVPSKRERDNNFSQPFSESLIQQIVDTYRNGVIPHARFKKKSGMEMHQSMAFVSEEERYYASRWNGHLPLAPPVSESIDVCNPRARRRKLSAQRSSSNLL